mgnify:FL=1
MPAKDFKFISPGVFTNEIDQSGRLQTPGDVGPVIIGRSQKGPGLIPTQVNSFQEFVQLFGAPLPGGTNDDISRNGNSLGPTYGAYAAQAWLRNNSPVTFVRLVGKKHTGASTSAENDGYPGWQTTAADVDRTAAKNQAGAYGLFIIQSGTTATAASTVTGTLGAIFYINSGTVALSGAVYGKDGTYGTKLKAVANDGVVTYTATASTNRYVKAAAHGVWKLQVRDSGPAAGSAGGVDATILTDTKFNLLDASSENFIRRVFNTNPTLTNSTITDSTAVKDFWLGNSFEDEAALILSSDSEANQYAFIAPLDSGSFNLGKVRRGFSDPRTGWYFSQDLTQDTENYNPAGMQKLFRLVAKNTGRWASRSLKVSIRDIRAPSSDLDSYGTFTVLVRAMDDTDNRPKILEQFNNCNLNPASENYVARKIGDSYLTWSDDDRRYTSFGNYTSKSDYIYVEMNPTVNEGTTNPNYLPFGVYGPPAFKDFTDDTQVAGARAPVTGGLDYAYQSSNPFAKFGGDYVGMTVSGGIGANIQFPDLRLRVSASEGNPTDPRDVYFGVDTTFDRSGRPSMTIGGYTGPIASEWSDTNMFDGDGKGQKISYVFTLDDMCNTDTTSATNAVTGTNVYASGSRAGSSGGTFEALAYVNSTSWKNTLDAGADQFTTVLHGGFDGLNIKETEPFRNSYWDDITPTELNSYTFNSLKIAIDSLRDPENVEFDLAAMPGITNNTLNRNLVDMCQDRGDALAVIDLKDGYVPYTENTETIANRMGSVKNTISNKKSNLQINSSFGCAYYPWVQIQDTLNGALVWVPPSVAAIGAMSYGQARQELWFAPAGFTRGGLSVNNAAGLPVTNVRERLVSKDRDKLYEANINPIAQFPAEGIVIFGQKTLQVLPSALDRINVRRLLIYVKRQISRIAATLLFDQNVASTWNRFLGQAEPLLADVQARLGLEDYKLVLDSSTTTADLIDRNIMYAQVFLKPTRAIEFIAIDFTITDSGASFED